MSKREVQIKFIVLFFILSTSLTYGKSCLCQYPTTEAKYGQGLRSEIGLYKLGCKIWLLGQKNCKIRKTISINSDISDYVASSEDKISIGYVGHWSSSHETARYLDDNIAPLIENYGLTINIENTACYPMDDPYLVFKTVKSFRYTANNHLTVSGAQIRSVGMWDKLNPLMSKLDIYAMADSRESGLMFPKCSRNLNIYCLGIQLNDEAYCIDQGQVKIIKCIQSKASSKIGFWQYNN